ncbi:hypothetical protein TWF481_002753 [Arthrobotrys musiformis]|uniref:Protein kinase domain-containing protein n=1 Tax=Arthrobotrys musiformis TaxID=47236 RepID=A0AAV9VR54_9PEZI
MFQQLGYKGEAHLVLGHKFRLGIDSEDRRAFEGLIPNSPEHTSARREYLEQNFGSSFIYRFHELSPPATESVLQDYVKWGRIPTSKRVFQLVGQRTGRFYAGKYYAKGEANLAGREAALMRDLHDKNILPLMEVAEVFTEGKYRYSGDPPPNWTILVTKLCLADLAGANFQKWNKPDVLEALIQICEGLEFIHSKYTTHGNIDPSTVLIRRIDPIEIQISGFQSAFGIYPNARSMACAVIESKRASLGSFDKINIPSRTC